MIKTKTEINKSIQNMNKQKRTNPMKIVVSIVSSNCFYTSIFVHLIQQNTRSRRFIEMQYFIDIFFFYTFVCHFMDFSARSFAPSRCRCSRSDFDAVALSNCFDFK